VSASRRCRSAAVSGDRFGTQSPQQPTELARVAVRARQRRPLDISPFPGFQPGGLLHDELRVPQQDLPLLERRHRRGKLGHQRARVVQQPIHRAGGDPEGQRQLRADLAVQDLSEVRPVLPGVLGQLLVGEVEQPQLRRLQRRDLPIDADELVHETPHVRRPDPCTQPNTTP
jgi:hypothetical protein